MTERNGQVIGALQVEDTDEIMMITDRKSNTLIRTRVNEVNVIGRNTSGVRLIRTGDESVVGLERVIDDSDEDADA